MSKLVLIFLAAVTSVHSESPIETASATWIPESFSWEVYITLAVIIISCYLITVIFEKRNISQLLERPRSTPLEYQTTHITSIAEIPDRSSVDVLKETVLRSEGLQLEYDHFNSIRLSLEERSGLLERETEEVEVKLTNAMQLSTSLREGLNKQIISSKKECIDIREENQLPVSEIVGATAQALREHNELLERLEAARKEVVSLQLSLQLLREERNHVLSTAASIAGKCQDVAGESASVIRKFVKLELEKNKMESAMQQTSESSSTSINVHENSVFEKTEMHSEAAENYLYIECEMCQEMESEEIAEKQERKMKLGPVTGSLAFRNFLLESIK